MHGSAVDCKIDANMKSNVNPFHKRMLYAMDNLCNTNSNYFGAKFSGVDVKLS